MAQEKKQKIKCIIELQKYNIPCNVIEKLLDPQKHKIKDLKAYKNNVIKNYKNKELLKKRKFIYIDEKEPYEAEFLLNKRTTKKDEDKDDDFELLWNIIEKDLQPEQKKLLKKYFLEGYKLKEIAEKMADESNIKNKGTKEKFRKAIYKRYERGLEKIRKIYLKKIKK